MQVSLKTLVNKDDVVEFVAHVAKSQDGQSTQRVTMRVEKVTDKTISGVNVQKILNDETKDVKGSYRTFRQDRIVEGTFYKRLF